MTRIAMWSGPRNLSTALMRSFSSRADCHVSDEPFYAAYLALTGLDHPMRAEIIADGEVDAGAVAAHLVGPVPGGRAIWYQKHMTHHMVDGVPRAWAAGVTNVFLIRHPARVLASYEAKRENPVLADLGIVQQGTLYDALGGVVVDADDLLRDPPAMLARLCAAIGVGWDPAMLSWPAGPHPADGVWGAHWYGRIWESTGFSAGAVGPVPTSERPELLAPALEVYTRLYGLRLKGT